MNESKMMELILKVGRLLGPETSTKDCWAFIEKAVDDKVRLMEQEPPEGDKD